MTRRLLDYGDSAVLLEVDDLDAVLALMPALERTRPPEVVELVPGARTVLAVHAPGAPREAVRAWLTKTPADAVDASSAALVELPVRYDGPDLAEVAALLGVTVEEVVRRHTARPWSVAFGGFAPGFAYLSAPASGLEVPRRTTPRPRVPAGSVGLAGTFSGVYPRDSPGGWQLIGRTEALLWDAARTPPALLTPGTRVRFVEVPP
ncbi:5-oxoprolinase subunit B family protein [Herbiconiux sp. SYSU D00978]|uniref:5-oxoprolinase subunit B family protein n=1 Tax=Herbiconiux sp. SYSU D00978 TaxID=2812562 RepID=UPI001A9789EE|nr:allophanate hydrolase subunit 1 [Herbiconiux sp. SYSU D00978]